MPVDRATGRVVADRYELKERLGQGGMGVVWRAWDTLLRRHVAVKMLQIPLVPDDADRARLRARVLREARAAARLSHPGVVTVFDVVDDDEPAIIMELVDSPTLAELVRSNGPMAPADSAAVGLELLDALAAAHAEGIVHRDVKPANVMVSERGRVRLSDFGLAALVDDPTVTASMTFAGSPSYMAPEQATTRERGPAADLWSLGATLYFAVEGQPPYDKGSAIPTLTSIVSDPPRPPTRAGGLGPVLDALLVKEPDARPAAADLRRLLEAAAATTPPVLGEKSGAQGPLSATETAPSPSPVTEPAVAEVAEPTATEPNVAEVAESAPRRIPLAPERTAGGGTSDVRSRRVAVGGMLVVVLALVGALIVSLGRSSDTGSPPETAAGSPTTQASSGRAAPSSGAATSATVPADWKPYSDPATGFTISQPPAWTVRTNGTLTDFVDPTSGAYLRVDHVAPPGPSPEQDWLDYEPRFAAENPGYRRIQITPTTYAGFPAAIWEFTYGSGSGEKRAVDLGFVTGRYGFALNFQTRSADWDRLQPVFDAFKASFKAPA